MTDEPDHLCHACVTDKFLKAEIKADGVKAVCRGCGKKRPAVELGALARRIDDAVQQHFAPSHNDEGQDWGELVAEQAGIASALAEEMRRHLSGWRGYRALKDGEDDIYASTVAYEEGRLDRGQYRRGWERFKAGVKQEARFFNRHAETYLGDIFTDIEQQASWAGKKVIVEWKVGEATPLVRGRVAQSDAELTTYLSAPAKELGPPPQGTGSAGRMNAAGVSTFYGALDLATCRAEVRPPVGSHAVFARFDVLRPLRILDMDALARIAVPGSIFDNDYATRLARAAFLRNFGDEISQPVMPRDEAFGYLPTQVIADYIGQRLKLDGILYRSVQSGRKRDAAGRYPQNIVLFNHASRIEQVDVSRVKVEVDLGWVDEEENDADDSISVREDELPKKRRQAKPKHAVPIFSAGPVLADADERPATLRLMPGSITVERIRGVAYDPDERLVTRIRRSLTEQRDQRRRWAKLTNGRGKLGEDPDLF